MAEMLRQPFSWKKPVRVFVNSHHISLKREHQWCYDEQLDGHCHGYIYCDACDHCRTNRKDVDGSDIPYDYIDEDDEPPCPGYRVCQCDRCRLDGWKQVTL